MTIVSDDGILGGEPRIEGTRIGVRHVAAHVIEGGQSPAYVADQFDVSLAEIYESMAYYYEHPDEISEIERANEAARERLEDESLRPRELVE